jgi:Arc/MetJ-type ribon-helix-helix transcriptional regulator
LGEHKVSVETEGTDKIHIRFTAMVNEVVNRLITTNVYSSRAQLVMLALHHILSGAFEVTCLTKRIDESKKRKDKYPGLNTISVNKGVYRLICKRFVPDGYSISDIVRSAVEELIVREREYMGKDQFPELMEV